MIKIQIGQDAASASQANLFDLISSLVSSLAWPVAAVIVALTFRKPIVSLLSKITRFGFGGASFEIGEALNSAEIKAKEEPIAPDQKAEPKTSSDFETLRLPPEAIVMLEWREIEQLIGQAVAPLAQGERPPSPFEQRRLLAKLEVVSPTTVSIIQDLSQVRNRVAHGGEIAQSDAIRYFELAQQVKADLRRALSANAVDVAPSA